MKRKALSLLMALCLMLTLAPAAFAVEGPDTIVGPNGQICEIPEARLAEEIDTSAISTETSVLSVSDTDNDYTGTGTQADPYVITTALGLYQLGKTEFQGTTVTYSYVKIAADIDLGELTASQTPSEWNGYFKYFYGEIYGVQVTDSNGETRYTTIKGIASNCFLIYGWCGGKIQNLTIDPDGKAGCLTYAPMKLSGAFRNFEVNNVTAKSEKTVNLTQGDNQANYALFVFAGAGTFSMTNCVNYVDVTGTSYGSVFHGYYPYDPTGTYTFTNCVNYGTITMKHAAMFFGNNSAFTGSNKTYYAFNADNVSANRIQFSNCVNNGKIYGTQTANLFSARASGNGAADEISDAYESYLNTSGSKPENSVQVIGQDLGMTLTYDASGNLSMTAATNTSNTVDHYVVSVYSYVNAYYTVDDSGEYFSDGTDRVGVQQTLTGSATTIDLKYYGLCDYPYDTEGLTFEDDTIGGFFIANYNGHKYYWVNSAEEMPRENGTYYFFVGSPSQPAVKNTPDLVTLSAYSATGTLLGTVSATPEGE